MDCFSRFFPVIEDPGQFHITISRSASEVQTLWHLEDFCGLNTLIVHSFVVFTDTFEPQIKSGLIFTKADLKTLSTLSQNRHIYFVCLLAKSCWGGCARCRCRARSSMLFCNSMPANGIGMAAPRLLLMCLRCSYCV